MAGSRGSLSVRKKNAAKARAKAKQPSTGDYLNTLKDVFFVNPRNSAGATLGGAAYDYISKATPQSVMRDARSGISNAAQDAKNWAVKEGRALRAAPISESARLLKTGYIDPLIEPFNVVKQAATARAAGNEGAAKKMAAMVPLAVFGAVNPELGGAGKLAVREGVQAAVEGGERVALKGAEKAADKLAAKEAAAAKKAADKLAAQKAAEKQAAAIKAAQAKRFSVTTKQVEADKARAAAARASKTKYAAIEPHPNPHPDLVNFEFPQGAGLGGAHAIEHGVPIVGIKPSVAQASSGYSGLASSVPANQVVANVTEAAMVPRIIRTPEEIAKNFAAGIPLTGDALINGLIHEVNGRPQVGSTLAEGGPGYPRRMAFEGDPNAWASIGSVVSDIDNRRAFAEDMFEGPVAGVYTRMGNTALDQTTAMMDLLGRQLAAGGVTKANLKIFDQKIKAFMGEDFAKKFIGFEKNPQAAAAQLNDISTVRMPQRTAIIQALDSANAMMAGFPDIGANRVGATVPELLYAPEGASGYMISGLSKNEGLRAGRNAPDIAHSNYPKKQSGEYFGGTEQSVPRELMFSDYAKAMHGSGYDPNQVHSYLFSRTPAEIKEAFGYDPRIQKFDQEWVDRNSKYLEDIAKYGHVPFAQGGLAVKPRQGRSSGLQSLAVRSPNKKASKARRAGS